MAEDRPVSTVQSDYATPAPSLPALDGETLEPPRASFFSGPGPSIGSIGESSPRDSRVDSATGPENDKEGTTPGQSTTLLPVGKEEGAGFSQPATRARPFYRRPAGLAIALGALVAVVLAIALPASLIHKGKHSGSNGSSGSGNGTSPGSGNGNPKSPTNSSNAITGGDGSTIISGNTSFVYTNSFGGIWYYDPNDPFNNAARPNSWTPPLNTSWDWSTNHAYGVNLGGLFVLEPFISPALFEKYPSAVDEWTLSQAMAADTGPGGGLQSQLEAHYDTFITEQDIAEIAGAGLNWIRLPIPYWAIEVWPGEPFLERVCWKYILRLFGWARKYGLRIFLDLHTVPGSQNGYNHSGKYGQINFLNGIMGYANAQRTLDYIRIITEFISQPEYQDVIPMFGIINEALVTTIGQNELTSFYLQAHTMIRGITGYGEGNGPYIVIHDGFNLGLWAGFLPGSDRIALDTHPYLAFDGSTNSAPVVTDDGLGEPGGTWPAAACDWGSTLNQSQVSFGLTVSGEFSTSYVDCGLFVSGVGVNETIEGDCLPFIQWQNFNETFKEGLLDFTLASMDALQNWWYWTWKVGNSTTLGTVGSPLWSYKLGLQNGWMPTDPRKSVGKCKALNAPQQLFPGTYSSWQTGGAGAGTIAASETASYPWPPATLSGLGAAVYAYVPTYTPTSSISTLPPAQLTPSASEGDGWYNTKDTASAMITVSGCSYPNAWDSAGAVAPTALCPPGATPAITATAARTTASASARTTVSA